MPSVAAHSLRLGKEESANSSIAVTWPGRTPELSLPFVQTLCSYICSEEMVMVRESLTHLHTVSCEKLYCYPTSCSGQ
jgi:hypothetical protein